MNVDFAFGGEERSFQTPSGVGVDYVVPVRSDAIEDVAGALDAACESPVESRPLSKLTGPDTSVLIVVADLTRSPATKTMLPAVIEGLAARGVERDQIRILIARGTHRSLSREEKKWFRSGVLRGLTVDEHDCDDSSSLSALLLTRRGTPVRIHRAVRDADRVVLLSPISFHYFAGFGGGRKLILPGCADRDAILANHRLSLRDVRPVTLHPSCRPGNLEGNPVHEDMSEAANALSHLFAVNFFADLDGNVTFINAGDPAFSHDEACAAYARVFRVPVAPASVVVAGAGGWPHDINLLQTHKALFHAAQATAPGGSILLFARCSEGVGSESLAAAIAMPRDEYFKGAYQNYALNNQTAVSLLGLTSGYRVAMVTELDDDTLQRAGIERCGNAEAWVAEALEGQGADRIAVIPHAGVVLPQLQE